MLELARAEEWEAVRALSVQVHDLHVAWRPDIFCASQAPYPYELYIEDIQKRMVYVAKISEQIVGYVTLSIAVKNAPGLHPHRSLHIPEALRQDEIRRDAPDTRSYQFG